MNAGLYGLMLTHIKIIQDAILKGYKNFLLLEDDVTFNENINEIFYKKIESLPTNWDLLYLGGNNVFHQGNFNLITGDINFRVTKENYKTLNHELCKTTWTQCAHALGMNSKFYNTALMAISQNSKQPIDIIYPLLQQSGYNAYTFLPSLALQRPSFSDINNKFVNYDSHDVNNF